jgi:hypothetical protein
MDSVGLTLTAMMYAMVKKVVNPARTSRVNLAPAISFSCTALVVLTGSSKSLSFLAWEPAHMATTFQAEDSTEGRSPNFLVYITRCIAQDIHLV